MDFNISRRETLDFGSEERRVIAGNEQRCSMHSLLADRRLMRCNLGHHIKYLASQNNVINYSLISKRVALVP